MVFQLDCDTCAHHRPIFWVRDLDHNLHCPVAAVLHELHFQSGHAVGTGDPVTAEDVQLMCKAYETLLGDVHQVAGPAPDRKGDDAFLRGKLGVQMSRQSRRCCHKCDLSSNQRSPSVGDNDLKVGVFAEDLTQVESMFL